MQKEAAASTVKVRFAPSPTGNLHIGSARTALFNWLYARSQGGKFILRVEDTDKERSKKEFLDSILADMKWLGMDWDEGPYFQSTRHDIYKEYAEKLLIKELAYKDGEAIIFKVPKSKEVFWYDVIHDKITVNTDEIKDQVLIKSDGTASYNFACVIDDALMGVTHVIRGDDHISNTPKQILIYEALEFKLPKFAHIPLILGPDKKRLSKRFCATSIGEYREMGFLPEAIINYLALLGWSPGKGQEIVKPDLIIKKFSIKQINAVQAVFDFDKFKWVNSQYIRSHEPAKLCDFVFALLVKKEILKPNYDKEYLKKVINLFITRFSIIDDLIDQTSFMFKDDYEVDNEAVKQFLSDEKIKKHLFELGKLFSNVEYFKSHNIEEATRKYIEQVGLTGKDIIHPLRVAVTGRSVSPSIFELLEVLGKKRTTERLSKLRL